MLETVKSHFELKVCYHNMTPKHFLFCINYTLFIKFCKRCGMLCQHLSQLVNNLWSASSDVRTADPETLCESLWSQDSRSWLLLSHSIIGIKRTILLKTLTYWWLWANLKQDPCKCVPTTKRYCRFFGFRVSEPCSCSLQVSYTVHETESPPFRRGVPKHGFKVATCGIINAGL